ncbi:5'-nucleotidase, lipoprotein e(P4) family [Paracoccus lutimaris]|uniref:5'-nucleotidase (Lipoprotein e(P4) family) n=1 Tax=Paracoccus lutimaris TaxID=1490030 RepID=A0A368ZAK8_9RHOB|nr:HAD family acid phosphatase [Paracoccus lutimaris]RCW88227.1 5'-nucleotidase (lipoprotein e(P4) family) [Paracoccus lutimaris]
MFKNRFMPGRSAALALTLTGVMGAANLPAQAEEKPDPAANALLYAVAWKQTAAEYRALYHQGYNIARDRVDAALAAQKPGDKPLAVFTDMDDTVLLPLPYWSRLISGGHAFFDDPVWDEWVPQNDLVVAPGAKEFFEYCQEKGVEVFYVTSRDQGPNTYDYALGNLKALGLPYADPDHLTVLTDSSNKEPRQQELAAKYTPVVYLGDNLNDFQRKYYIKGDVPARIAAMEEDRAEFGRRFVLFPNPTDGHWMAAVFGESEPADTPEARAKLLEAAVTVLK